mgnify:CR=1 FL=1
MIPQSNLFPMLCMWMSWFFQLLKARASILSMKLTAAILCNLLSDKCFIRYNNTRFFDLFIRIRLLICLWRNFFVPFCLKICNTVILVYLLWDKIDAKMDFQTASHPETFFRANLGNISHYSTLGISSRVKGYESVPRAKGLALQTSLRFFWTNYKL